MLACPRLIIPFALAPVCLLLLAARAALPGGSATVAVERRECGGGTAAGSLTRASLLISYVLGPRLPPQPPGEFVQNIILAELRWTVSAARCMFAGRPCHVVIPSNLGVRCRRALVNLANPNLIAQPIIFAPLSIKV